MHTATTALASPYVAVPSGRPWVILVALAVLAVGAAIEPRVVPRDHWLVVLRAGRAHRVLPGGLAIRIPLLERYICLPKASTHRPFVITTRSQDGVEVRLSGEITVRIMNPAVAVANALSPLDLALDETERALIRTVAALSITALADLPPYLDLPVEVPGVQVTALDLADLEIALSLRNN